jgi:hypothetical protein
MDCKDVAAFITLMHNAVGIPFEATTWTSSPSLFQGFGFRTQPICGIGSDSTMPWTYVQFDFTHHAVARPVGSNNIVDGSAAQWLHFQTGTGYQNPPVLWPLAGYWQSPSSRGLVELPSPSSAVPFNMNMSNFTVR